MPQNSSSIYFFSNQKHAEKCRLAKRYVYYNWCTLLLQHWFSANPRSSFASAKTWRVGDREGRAVGLSDDLQYLDYDDSDVSESPVDLKGGKEASKNAAEAKRRKMQMLTSWTGETATARIRTCPTIFDFAPVHLRSIRLFSNLQPPNYPTTQLPNHPTATALLSPFKNSNRSFV